MFLAKSYCDIGNSQSSSSTVAQDGEITTTFEYDGIQRLVRVTDTEGNVTKTRRTMIVPNQAIATYVTQWTYDSHNRLLEMIYPDEEKLQFLVKHSLKGII